MILQVHDELNFSVPEAEKEIIQKIVIENNTVSQNLPEYPLCFLLIPHAHENDPFR